MIKVLICNDLGDEMRTKIPVIPDVGDIVQWVTDNTPEEGFMLSKVISRTHVFNDNGKFMYIEIYVEDI
jgi:hypothetical protein